MLHLVLESAYPINPLSRIDPLGLKDAVGDFAGAGGHMDEIIINETSQYNLNRGFSSNDQEYLDPLTIMAMIRVESGCIEKARKDDPMQVNVPGDWDPAKKKLGLEKGVIPGQDLSIQAGIGWLTQKKAYISDAKGNKTFIGWERGVARYNGGGDDKYLKKFNKERQVLALSCPAKPCSH